LATEAEVAGFIGERFRMLADAARRAPPAGPELDAIRRDLAAFRDALIAERQRLIRQETELYPMV
jgi:hypothetical protein